jgi:hypothetical protein
MSFTEADGGAFVIRRGRLADPGRSGARGIPAPGSMQPLARKECGFESENDMAWVRNATMR